MLTNNLGYPRIGSNRELKKACENYWAGKIRLEELLQTGKEIRVHNWKLQQRAGIDLIPSNDFSFYDHVLDLSMVLGVIPERYSGMKDNPVELYFAMARGCQRDGVDVTAMEMTKWFDTNYHYIVPEFSRNQQFELFSTKILDDFLEAKQQGIHTKPVIIGPVSYLLLGKEKDEGFSSIDLIEKLLPVYLEIISGLVENGVEWIQFDEPFLAMDLNEKEEKALVYTYGKIRESFPELKTILAVYFEGIGNYHLAASLPICALHLDLVRNPGQVAEILIHAPKTLSFSLGIIDGRNIWKNDFQKSLKVIGMAVEKIGKDRVILAPSCSLLHSPCDLDSESNNDVRLPEIKQWLAFAKQKIDELIIIRQLANSQDITNAANKLKDNMQVNQLRQTSPLIHNEVVKARTSAITGEQARRTTPYSSRKIAQAKSLQLPLFPTTTIGSFPQTAEVRSWRAQFRNGNLTQKQYDELIRKETEETIRFQEEIGIDVLVHGEFERNDMVEYFGERLEGFAFTKNGWVQSYGSRCVKPPIIFGDVSRPLPMTVRWSSYAQSITQKHVKGMLTGPVTILQWSFVRNDQARSETCKQIALAIRDEVADLEKAGINIIQIDEPALREGLPLRKEGWAAYLEWAVAAFRIASSGVREETQIHTHMCYSEFNDIIENIAKMDADVITIECSRSQMELLDAFADYSYPNGIGPGVYDIHSPRVPSKEEMLSLLEKAQRVIPAGQLWVNPDCGLKTRHWDETRKALIAMVAAANEAKTQYAQLVS